MMKADAIEERAGPVLQGLVEEVPLEMVKIIIGQATEENQGPGI